MKFQVGTGFQVGMNFQVGMKFQMGMEAELPAHWSPDTPPSPNIPRVSSFGYIALGPPTFEEGDYLLRLSSSSVFVAPGLKCLKGAMKADNMLTLSGKKRRTGNALWHGISEKFCAFICSYYWGFGQGRLKGHFDFIHFILVQSFIGFLTAFYQILLSIQF